jgi:hypothetical protein
MVRLNPHPFQSGGYRDIARKVIVMSENSTQDVQLTPAEAAFFAEAQRAAAEIQQRAQGALLLILRQRGLDGDWKLDGDKLVKQ